MPFQAGAALGWEEFIWKMNAGCMEYHIDGICASLELLKSSMKFSAKARGRKKNRTKQNGKKEIFSANVPKQEREIAASAKENQL